MPAMRESVRGRETVVVALACIGALTIIGFCQDRYGLSGLAVDRDAVAGWLAGDGLYAYRSPVTRLGTDASPVTALLLAPVAGLPLPVLGWLIGLGGVAALLLALLALAGPVARRYGRPRGPAVLIAAALALTTEPVRAALGLGHLDLILFGLVVADIVALRRAAWARSRAAWWPGRPASQPIRGSAATGAWSSGRFLADPLRRGWATGAWAGVGTGIATALAVGPVLFVAYLMVSRQWRAALTALGTAATLLLGAVLFAPSATATWAGTVLPQVDRGGPIDSPANQSLAGVLTRLYDSAGTPVLVWLSFAVLLLAVGLIRARSAHADGDEIAAFTLVGLAGAAIGPVTRTPELIWLLPAVLILVNAAARRRVVARRPRPSRFPGAGRAAGAAVVVVLLMLGPSWTPAGNAYAFAVIILLNALPWRPGVAPALLVYRRPAPARRVPAIPGPRGS